MLPSADLAGRAVAISIEVPAAFDAPLAPHHKLIGRWVAARDDAALRFTRTSARRHIERTFENAVREVLEPINLAELRVVALIGDETLPPAIAIICDTVGQLDLGWIETSGGLLSDVMKEPGKRVALPSWGAAAYKALGDTLGLALPIFGYTDLFEEMSAYYWDGATDDVAAANNMIECFGVEPDEVDEDMLPSKMNARRPAWMIAENAAPLAQLPKGLAERIRKLRATHKALLAAGEEDNAWRFEFDTICQYIEGFEDCGHLPPMTLVPAEHFARELDDAGRHGMEMGLMDVAGLCPLLDASRIDAWFTTLKLGADFLLAAQDLIAFDPANDGGSA